MNFDERISKIRSDLVNKMLEPHGVTMQYVIDNPFIDGLPWYEYYTTTPEQAAAFKVWALELLTKKYKYPRKWAEMLYAELTASYGLKTKNNSNEQTNN